MISPQLGFISSAAIHDDSESDDAQSIEAALMHACSPCQVALPAWWPSTTGWVAIDEGEKDEGTHLSHK